MSSFKKMLEEKYEKVGHLLLRREDGYLISDEVRQWLKEGRRISLEERQNLRLNSYEWEVIIPLLDDEALISATRHAILNSTSHPCTQIAEVYDISVIHRYAPELIRRLEERSKHE